MLNLTSAEVSGSPLWNLTPGRSLNSQVVSLTVFHSVASCGISFRSGSRVVRLSKIWNDTVMLFTAVLIWGSKSVTSALVTTTRFFLSAGALSTAETAVGWAAGAAAWAAAGLAAGWAAGASGAQARTRDPMNAAAISRRNGVWRSNIVCVSLPGSSLPSTGLGPFRATHGHPEHPLVILSAAKDDKGM